MKKKQVWKVISLLLSVILLFSSVPISAISLEISDAITNELETPSAVSESGGESVTVTETPKTIDLHAGEKGIFELQAMQVDLAALPEVIDQAVALEKGHVNRLTAQEDSLSTVIYQNSDGTKSTYLFSTPVKYVDESGAVRDKSSKVTAITDTLYSHAMLNNSTKVYFPKSAANGTKVSFGDYSITMSPKTSVQSAATQQSDRNLMYANVFGKGTILSYSTEMNGLKEDIILALNVGISSFDFVLVATNVTPVQIDGVWCFQNADGAVVAKLGSIDVRDSAGNTTTGTLTLTPIEVAGKYDVTVSVDESFLNASTTTYPVYIDPTVRIDEMGYYDIDNIQNTYNSILDTGLYNTEAGKNAALSDPYYHSLGTGKIIYKFPGFYDTYTEDGAEYHYSTLYNLNDTQIGTAKLYFLESDGLDLSIAARPMIDTWDEATVGENPVALYDLDLFTAYSTSITCWEELDYVAGMEYRELDVTRIFREWARYNEFERINSGESNPYLNPANGFALMSETSEYCEIAATETTGTSAVYIVLDTSTISDISLIYHPAYTTFLRANSTTTLTTIQDVSDGDVTKEYHWKFDYLGNNRYYVRLATNPNYILCIGAGGYSIMQAPNGILTSATCRITTTPSTGELFIRNYNSTYTLYFDGSQVGVCATPSSGDTNYSQTVWRIMSTNAYQRLTSFTISVNDNKNWMDVGAMKAINIHSNPDGAKFDGRSYFIWESSDPSVATIDADGHISAVGNGFVKITGRHKITGKTASVWVSVGCAVPSGTYYIMNKAAGLYLDCEDAFPLGNESNVLEVTTLNKTLAQQWQIQYVGNGCYNLRVFDQAYAGVIYDSSATDLPVGLQTSGNITNSLWRIYRTDSGALKLISEYGQVANKCLAIPTTENANGVNCIQSTYVQDKEYYDEWYFANVDYFVDIQVLVDRAYIQELNGNLDAVNNKITGMMNPIRERYMRDFWIGIEWTNVLDYVSYGDQCETCDWLDPTCKCGPDIPDHKDLKNILSNAPAPDIDDYVVLVLTGYFDPFIKGVASSQLGKFLVGYYSSRSRERATIMHEFNHLFYVEDHYGQHTDTTADKNNETGSQLYSCDCIHGENKGQLYTNPLICEGCKLIIEANAGRFGH